MDQMYLASKIGKGIKYTVALGATAATTFGAYYFTKDSQTMQALPYISPFIGGLVGLGLIGIPLENLIAYFDLRRARKCMDNNRLKCAEHFANEARIGLSSVSAEADEILVEIAKTQAA